jgi:UDP-2,3-diacylglucosamine pyrophosphatase LpxH
MEMTSEVFDTIILSDLHLSDAEPHHHQRPLWKKFKQKQFFIDEDVSNFLTTISNKTQNKIELVLNGDIFDFDSVMSVPSDDRFRLKQYEHSFGLKPQEARSVFKIDMVLKQHEVFVKSLSDFIKKGNKVVFVIGNHDIELNWVSVQKKIMDYLQLTKEERKAVLFCEWCYVSNNDTLIEHGHQYDPYCMVLDPINPVVKKNGDYIIRLPFGNLANRFMINVMGFKNPHNDESYVKTFSEFIQFFFKYEIRNQPLIVVDWLKGAIKTLIYSIGESFLPRVKDPMTYNSKLKRIAKKSNISVEKLLSLRENHAHPAVRRPMSVIRELWLDRAFLLFAIILLAWQLFSMIAVFISIPFAWFFLPLSILLSIFGYYANGVGGSEVRTNQRLAEDMSIASAKICGVKRVVLGHTHSVYHKKVKNYEVLNPGTWSIFFQDVECTKKEELFTFVWIKPGTTVTRDAKIYRYKDNDITVFDIKKS